MDLLDRLLGHDAWTTRQLLLRATALTNEQLDRRFDIGLGTVRATFEHVVRNMEVWTDLMTGAPIRPPAPERKAGGSVEAMIARLDLAAADFARLARSVAARHGWDKTWLDTLDNPPAEKTFGGAIAHVITHSMHHRAQLLAMLRRLDVEGLPEGDVLNWESEAKGLGPRMNGDRSVE